MRGRALQRAPEFHRDRVLSIYEHELISLAPQPLQAHPSALAPVYMANQNAQ
jgi:hypothetical protein